MLTSSKIAKARALKQQASVRRARSAPGNAGTTTDTKSPVTLGYALKHPRDRVVVRGEKYSVIIPELDSSKISDDDLRAVMYELVK